MASMCYHLATSAEVFMTAYSGLFWSGQLRDGESVLIHAVSGCSCAWSYESRPCFMTAVLASSDCAIGSCSSSGRDAVFYKHGTPSSDTGSATGTQYLPSRVHRSLQGASGVGLSAIQLAKTLVRNVTVFVTASEAHPCAPASHHLITCWQGH